MIFNVKDKNPPVDMDAFLVVVNGRYEFNKVCEFMLTKGFPISKVSKQPNAPIYNDIFDFTNLIFIKNSDDVWGFYGIPTEIIINCKHDKFTFNEFVERYISPPKELGCELIINSDLLGKY